MIPTDYIIEWRNSVPWQTDAQVEQDLIISRAIVEIFSSDLLARKLTFRGGTALHKLQLAEALRYSEDLDFLQRDPEGIGETFDAIRSKLDHWLGEPRRELKQGGVKLLYRFETEEGRRAKLKVEINSREHFAAGEIVAIPYQVKSRWFSGRSEVSVLSPAWLLGSKLRALYQRRKGRDLFDLVVALQQGLALPEEVVAAFRAHLKDNGQAVSRAELEENLHYKLTDKIFLVDLSPLLAGSAAEFDFNQGWDYLSQVLVAKVPGEPWKGKTEPS